MSDNSITNNTLSEAEKHIFQEYKSSLDIPDKQSDDPTAVLMVGLVASGKTYTASIIADRYNLAHIRADSIRTRLRKQNCGYANVRTIVEKTVREVTAAGYGVVVDSDFASGDKRTRIEAVLSDAGAGILYVRTHVSFDTAIARVFGESLDQFFRKAGSNTEDTHNGKVVKIREMIRRLPHHYEWQDEDGGRWQRKPFSFVDQEVDTGRDVGEQVERLPLY